MRLDPAERQRRARDMADRYARGDLLKVIGADYGVSRERARQIVMATGSVQAGESRRARQARAAADRTRLRTRIVEELEEEPAALTREQAAARFGMSTGTLVGLLGADAKRLLRWAPGGAPARYSDEDILAALRSTAGRLGRSAVSRKAYDRLRREVGGLPSAVRIIQRFGTWNEACAAAGLSISSPRPTYANHRSDEQILRCLRDYAAQARSFTASEYDRIARQHPEWPSSAHVRVRLGSWNEAKRAALTPGYTP